MAITSYAKAEGNEAANVALENYVAYFKLSHGSIPRERTISRIGLSLGMNVVDPRRILENADRLAEQLRGTPVEKAAKNGDVATAMSLINREKEILRTRPDALIVSQSSSRSRSCSDVVLLLRAAVGMKMHPNDPAPRYPRWVVVACIVFSILGFIYGCVR